MMRRTMVVLALCLASLPAAAIQPDEVMNDPVLEARARAITKELRCVVCQSESIDESNAEIAGDLRQLVRERLAAGDTDAEAVAFIVDRYGEYVLFRPRFSLANAPLWFAGPLFLVIGGGLAFVFIRRRSRAVAPERAPLSAAERARLEALTGD